MGQLKTIEELQELRGDELKAYLLSLPEADRRRVVEDLLKVHAEMDAQDWAEIFKKNEP